MSVMEKRLQLLLDQERYDRVAAEAKRTGRSVAAVIREAIDFRFDGDPQLRIDAIRSLLDETRDTHGVEPEWSETKAEMDRELDEKLSR